MSLEAWLGMLADALLSFNDDPGPSMIYKKILGPELSRLLDAAVAPLTAALETGSTRGADGLIRQLEQLFEAGVRVWKADSFLTEGPTLDWLRGYLQELDSGTYQAWAFADRVWAVYSYYVWTVSTCERVNSCSFQPARLLGAMAQLEPGKAGTGRQGCVSSSGSSRHRASGRCRRMCNMPVRKSTAAIPNPHLQSPDRGEAGLLKALQNLSRLAGADAAELASAAVRMGLGQQLLESAASSAVVKQDGSGASQEEQAELRRVELEAAVQAALEEAGRSAAQEKAAAEARKAEHARMLAATKAAQLEAARRKAQVGAAAVAGTEVDGAAQAEAVVEAAAEGDVAGLKSLVKAGAVSGDVATKVGARACVRVCAKESQKG